MDWNKQAEVMLQTWTEAQKKMWESWYDLTRSVSKSDSTPFSFYPDLMKQWQEMATQGINAWTAGSDPIVGNTARQLVASQEAFMRFLQILTQTWQAIAPKIEAGEDWQALLKEYSNRWFQSLMGSSAGAVALSKDMNELWQFYIQEWQKLAEPWLQSWTQSSGRFGHVMLGGGSELAELTRFHWDVYERTFGGITEIPGLGYNRELNAKLLNGFDAWVDLQRASAEYHTILSKTWAQAFERFIQKLIEIGEKGEVIDSIRDVMNLWFETVDQTFTKMYISEEYLRIQKDLAGSAMKYKMQQQEIVEVFMKMNDLPTRTELDDAYRSLNELRKEVKALKKALNAQTRPEPVKSDSKPATSRKTASAKKTNQTAPKESAEAVATGSVKGD